MKTANKTAVSQAIADIKALQAAYSANSVRWWAYMDALDILTSTALPDERKGIEDAYTEGYTDGSYNSGNNSTDYFEQTYGI